MDERQHLEMYKGFPVLTRKQRDAANDLFTAYLFFKEDRKNGEHHIWTSCCHVADYIIEQQRTISSEVVGLVDVQHNDNYTCPFCGKAVKCKNLSKAGKRRSIREYRNVVFLSADADGTLYAQGYCAGKEYLDIEDLAKEPGYIFARAYVFKMGEEPKTISMNWYNSKYNEAVGRAVEPFYQRYLSSYTYQDYNVIDLEQIALSSLKYCQYSQYMIARYNSRVGDPQYRHWCLMRYLSTYCEQPKIEIWAKLGFHDVVDDLAIRKVKNAAAIDWTQNDPKKALGLTKPEFKSFLKYGRKQLGIIAAYKTLKRHKQTTDFKKLCEMDLMQNDKLLLAQMCVKRKLKFDKVVRYLEKLTGPRCHGGWFGMTQAFQHWKDYIRMAQELQYDLTSEVVLLPKNLFQAHDAASRLISQVQMEKAAAVKAKEHEDYLERLKDLDTRYSFQFAGYHIRPPMSTQEIIDEGKALCHCVGGYASRHAEGRTTILFLRDDSKPSIPLVTIEMNGSTLVQIHGFKNERDGAPDPKVVYASILNPWLKWVSRGSKRKDDGTPILRELKKKALAETKKEVKSA